MKQLKHIILGFFLLVTMSVGVSAQRQDEPKKPPPKEKPGPKVKPGGENKPLPPREGNRPKKPEYGFVVAWRDEKIYTA